MIIYINYIYRIDIYIPLYMDIEIFYKEIYFMSKVYYIIERIFQILSVCEKQAEH